MCKDTIKREKNQINLDFSECEFKIIGCAVGAEEKI